MMQHLQNSEENNFQPRILYPARLSIKQEIKIKKFSYGQSQKIISRASFLRILLEDVFY